MRRSVIIILCLAYFMHVAVTAFNAYGIVIGGDCRPVRLVAMLATGLMAILTVALVYWRIRDAR